MASKLTKKNTKEIAELAKLELTSDDIDEFPPLGVTVIHKDMFSTKGVRTTAASKVLEGYIPEYSATVVSKMEEAGAIMLGKANQDAWAHGSSGENSDFGVTRNPYNKDYVPGGSSSGSAASVAAEFSLVATATDTCGSTRLPANFCGLVGLKPTYGAISRYGVIAMASSLDTVGIITNNIEDTKKVYDTIKVEDGMDATVKNPDSQDSNHKFKIGIPKEFFVDGLNDEVKDSIISAKKKLEKL